MKAESRRAADNPRKRIVNMGPHANVSYYLSPHGAVWSSPLLRLCGDPIPRPSATPPLLQEPRGGCHSGPNSGPGGCEEPVCGFSVNSHSVMDPSLPLSGHKESGNCIDGGKEPSSAPLQPLLTTPSLERRHHQPSFQRDLIYPVPLVPAVCGGGGEQCKSESGSSVCVLAPGGTVLTGRGKTFATPWRQPLKSNLDLGAEETGHGSVTPLPGLSLEEAELSIAQLCDWAARCDKERGGVPVLQSSDLPRGVVSIITGRDQLTQALANHSVIKAIWYWGSMEGCQFLQHTCSSPLKSLWLHCQEEDGGRDWAQPHPSLLEEMWRHAVQWKSVWIPTAYVAWFVLRCVLLIRTLPQLEL
ncbi:uncharacterized protein LOC115191632 [Salmo trutta]|uniref:uncharacterized protein LOC115191632 n=1 Tax=Salmo trutta TaxID=8032 RepID=UPI001131CC95|nr:uncharacterized protein LOC115191632 [Salmo trutta]